MAAWRNTTAACLVSVAVTLFATGFAAADDAAPSPASDTAQISRSEIVRSLTARPAGRAGADTELTRSLRPRGISIEDATPHIDLNIQFEIDSAVLSPRAKSQLRELAAAIKDPAIQNSRIAIIGHTDSIGSANYNRRLSVRRAKAVLRHLYGSYGVRLSRLEAMGYGETRLKDSANPTSPVNRRVEIRNLGTSK